MTKNHFNLYVDQRGMFSFPHLRPELLERNQHEYSDSCMIELLNLEQNYLVKRDYFKPNFQ